MRILRQQTGVATDLAETHEEREHRGRILRQQRSEFARKAAALGEMLVERTLFVGERARQDDLHLRRDVRRDMAFETPQDERRDLSADFAERDRRIAQHLTLEVGTLPEQARHQEAENRPQVRRAVLERRAGDRDPMIGLQRNAGLRRLGFGVLDGLGFVEHRVTEAGLGKQVGMATQLGVAGDP